MLVNGAGFSLGLGAGGGGSIMVTEIGVHNKLAEVGEFAEVTESDLVRWSWIDGSEERMWEPSLWIHLVPSASSVSSLKIASADRLHCNLYKICILYLFF